MRRGSLSDTDLRACESVSACAREGAREVRGEVRTCICRPTWSTGQTCRCLGAGQGQRGEGW